MFLIYWDTHHIIFFWLPWKTIYLVKQWRLFFLLLEQAAYKMMNGILCTMSLRDYNTKGWENFALKSCTIIGQYIVIHDLSSVNGFLLKSSMSSVWEIFKAYAKGKRIYNHLQLPIWLLSATSASFKSLRATQAPQKSSPNRSTRTTLWFVYLPFSIYIPLFVPSAQP